VSAEPEVVFPLLCPVREYEWLDGWECEMVYTQSGVADRGCIFKRCFGDVPETWHVNVYEPPQRIEYLVFAPDTLITRLTIELTGTGRGRTQLRWRRLFTSFSPAGRPCRSLDLRTRTRTRYQAGALLKDRTDAQKGAARLGGNDAERRSCTERRGGSRNSSPKLTDLS
jgi:hypothetical protein